MKLFILITLICTSASAETFKCVIAGHTTYSSSPCGSNSVPVQSRVTIGGHQVVPIVFEPYTPPARQAAPQPQVLPQQQKIVIDCNPQESALENIRSRMRAGYSAGQSAYFLSLEKSSSDALDNCLDLRKKYN